MKIILIPVTDKLIDDVIKIRDKYYSDFNAEVDISTEMMASKVAKAQIQKYDYILVVGNKEIQNDTVNVRDRNGNILGEMTHQEFKNFD